MSKSYWDKKLQRYAKKDWSNQPSLFAKEIVRFFPETGRVLDIGAGTGQDSTFFAKQGFKVTAMDTSVEVSKYISERDRIEIVKTDLAKRLPFDKNSFDIVYSHLALHYFDLEKTREIFAEVARVLKKGGMLAFLVNSIHDPETHDKEFTEKEASYYLSPNGIHKRFFSVADVSKFIGDSYEVLVLDEKGRTFKDEHSTLVRFVGRKN